jgi:hypothetical protein
VKTSTVEALTRDNSPRSKQGLEPDDVKRIQAVEASLNTVKRTIADQMVKINLESQQKWNEFNSDFK